MSPTDVDTSTGVAPRAGKTSADSWHTATTELRVVTGSCGRPARTMPAHTGCAFQGCFTVLGPSHLKTLSQTLQL